MEEEYDSFEEVLDDLKTLSGKSRDPRSLRLSAVASALVDVVQGEVTAAKVYASTVTTLEGTLNNQQQQQQQQQRENASSIVDSLVTQNALLELVRLTIPHVAPAALAATVSVTSRVLRGVVASCQAAMGDINDTNNAVMLVETQDELGGVNTVLRGACRASTAVLARLPSSTNEKAVRQLLYGTLLTLFQDDRPKVRKASHNGLCELLILSSSSACHSVLHKSVLAYVHSNLGSFQKNYEKDPLQNSQASPQHKEFIHLLAFLQRSILYMGDGITKLGSDLMEILMLLLQGDAALPSSNFVAPLSKKDSTSRVVTINAILSTVVAMLGDNEQEENNSSKKEQSKSLLDAFATRVLASLLQARPSLAFRDESTDLAFLHTGRTLYGQLVLSSCQRVLNSNSGKGPEEMARGCKLLALCVQLVVQLSRPSEYSSVDDATVAETLMVELTQLFRTRLGELRDTVDSATFETCTKDCLRAMEPILQQESLYKETHSVSLKALVVLLQEMSVTKEGDDHDHDDIQVVVERLCVLRSKPTVDKQTQYAIDDALSSLIQGVGLEQFWKWIVWNPEETKKSKGATDLGISPQRVWMLQVMKTAAMTAAVSTTESKRPRLAFFQQSVLSLARQCDGLSVNHPEKAAFHKSRVMDLWNLFPCFCLHPGDLEKAFPVLSPILIRAMDDKRYHPHLVTIVSGGLTALAAGVHSRLGQFEELADSEEANECQTDATTIGEEITKLLPALFKLVDALHTHSTGAPTDETKMDEEVEVPPANVSDGVQAVQVVARAIAALARLAQKPFLQVLFKKVVQRLLEASQLDEDLSDKMCSLLSLAQALVVSECLDDSSVSLLYRSLKPLIRTDTTKPRVQKRAYKVMAEICQRCHSFATEGNRLEELCELLTSSIFTSQISARHMRIKCLNNIVEGFDKSNKAQMETIPKLVGETVLCLKDSNAKTREAAFQLLLAMANTHKDDMPRFVQLVAGALGAETTHMRSAAVMALSRLVFEYSRDDPAMQALLPSLLQTVLVLFEDTSREVIKSVVGFVRVSVAAMSPEQLQPLLPVIVNGLLKYHKGKDRFRAKIKIILKKLVKLFGFNALEPLVPISDTRLLTHMRKLAERDIRRKSRIHEQRQNQERTTDFDGMVGSDEEDSDDGRTLMTGATGLTRMTTGRSVKSMAASKAAASRANRTVASSAAMSRKSKIDRTVRLRNDATGDVFDVSDLAAKSVRFAGDGSDDDDSVGGEPMEFDGAGKLIVRGDFDDNAVDPFGVGNEGEADKIEVASGRKRRLNKFETAKVEKEEQRKNQSKRNGGMGLGAAYKAKRAGGDSKKKGQKFEPYAFVPLDGRNYTKKNRRGAVEQMETVVRKGAKRQRR